jgi:hypothetical protein
MNSGSSSAGPTQGITPVAASYPPNIKLPTYPGEDLKPEREWEPEFVERFSKSLLRMRLQEFYGGKYTRRYIESYLDFMHLSGMVNNLEYLEFKNMLSAEQV